MPTTHYAGTKPRSNDLSADQADQLDELLVSWDFDHVLVGFSGGKDSLAALLAILDAGCPRELITLCHHDVDGGSEGGEVDPVHLFDWPCTEAYCRAVAGALGLRIRFSGRVGGFDREMARDDVATAPVWFEPLAGGEVQRVGGKGPAGTRLRFPMLSPDLSRRWCSAYLKIDVMRRVISNDPSLKAADRILVVTGERAAESANRASYARADLHACHKQTREVVQYRPVLDWSEADVWGRIQARGIVAHPCYRAGFGRASCALCIFGQADQWATARYLLPAQFAQLVEREAAQVAHWSTDSDADRASVYLLPQKRPRKGNPAPALVGLAAMADRGTVYPAAQDFEILALARSTEYTAPVLVDPAEWRLPAGAYATCAGPT